VIDAVPPILLVEDSRDDIELIKAALSTFHVTNRIDVARDGAEALDYLECRGKYADRDGGTPAFVLLDLKLPKVNGLQVLQRVRANQLLRTLPIVILTSSREELDLQRAYDSGANAYVVKPVKFEEFAQAVKEIGLFWAVLNATPPPRSC
jgi:CheY-like chemotaxis protein